jgi:hypothetical protein
MPDYTNINFWIYQIAAIEMVSRGETQISCNHLAMAACRLDVAIANTPQGVSREPMQRQQNQITTALGRVGISAAQLSEHLATQLGPIRVTSSKLGSNLIMFGPGVGEISKQADELAKPERTEAVHFLAALLERPTKELSAALKGLKVNRRILVDSLLNRSSLLSKSKFW